MKNLKNPRFVDRIHFLALNLIFIYQVGIEAPKHGEKDVDLFHQAVSRKNIAIDRRTYQSSEIDDYGSTYAITVPYFYGSKTRRLADSWWEIDLEKSFHLHSVSFGVFGVPNDTLELNVMLFKGPVGFEDPFLARYRGVAI